MLVYYILLPIGLVLIVVSLGVGAYEHLFIRNGTVTEGTVIGNVRQGRGFAPKIQIYTNEGRDIVFSPASSSNPPMYTEGDKVRVVYRGEDARILTFGMRFGLPWAFFCAGFALVIIAVGFRFGEAIMNSLYPSVPTFP